MRNIALLTCFKRILSLIHIFLANIDDNLYLMEEVAEHELVSKEFDAPKAVSYTHLSSTSISHAIHNDLSSSM